MTDPAPRSPQGWPLLAIALLVVLLSGFLYLRWSKREEAPAIVKEPAPIAAAPAPIPTPEPVKAPPASNPGAPTPAAPTPAQGKPADDGFEQALKDLRKAIEEKRWAAADEALGAARKLRTEAAELKGAEEQIAAGRKQEEAARAEAARQAEQKKKRDLEWAVLKDKIEKDSADNLWDSALGSLDAFAKSWPEAGQDEQYKHALKRAKEFQAESDKIFKQGFAEAQKHLAEERYGQAIASADRALKYYPERKAPVRDLQARARDQLSLKSMVRIPSTACWIGSETKDEEKPLRQVTLPPFLIDKYKVTNEEYFAFVSATGREAPPYWQGGKPPKDRDRHPVTLVSWDDAAAYAAWAGKRLPTAEEWEVAARGPDKREFPWGNVFQEKEDRYVSNCLEYWQLNKHKYPGTTAVDDKEFDPGVSAFGVYGMSGNVWEWTATAAPPKGTKPPPEFRILKGGSFATPQKALRCANVYAEDPRQIHPDVGFRCVRDVK